MPKPLLPIADKPILEIIIEQLRDEGIGKVHIVTHYKAEMIEADISRLTYADMKINFVRETEPRGTVGELALIRE